MLRTLKKMSVAIVVVALSAVQFGCGESSETNSPSVKLSASTVASSTDSAHQHSASIPFVDVSAAPLDAGYQYRSDTVNGHSHVIALSKQQMIDLNNGMLLTLTSSIPNSGASHTHSWSIQGGSVLYEKNCFNCHSNDKRNHNPMNVIFNASQASAVRSPGSAPVSTATAAIPDPNFIPGSGAPDGVALYAGACASCHGALASSTKPNRTAAQISAAISNVGSMNSLSTLTPAQVQAIATALVR